MRSLGKRQLPPQTSDALRRTSYDEWVNKAWYGYDDSAALEVDQLETVKFLETELSAARLGDERLAEQEADAISRIPCNWRHKGLLPFVYTDTSLKFSNQKQADLLKPFMKRLADEVDPLVTELASSRTVQYSKARYPIGKGKGAPFFAPGSNKPAAIALAAIPLLAWSAKEIDEICHGLGAHLRPYLINWYRLQGARKPRELMGVDADGNPSPTGIMTLLPKARKVQAVATVYNVVYAEVGSLLMDVLRESTYVQGLPAIVEAGQKLRGYAHDQLVSIDYSNYDDTIGVQLYQMTSEILVGRLAHAARKSGIITERHERLIVDVEETLSTLPLIAPPIAYAHAAEIVDREGGIVSGERLTSGKGTWINKTITMYVMETLGLKAEVVLVFGDDVIFAFKTPDQAATFRATVADVLETIGIVATIAPDSTFLMKRMPETHAYVARMVMSTMQKEDSKEPRSLTVSALGIVARREALVGHPSATTYDEWFSVTSSDRLRASYNLAKTMHFDPAIMSHAVAAEASSGKAAGGSKNASIEGLLDLYEELKLELPPVIKALTEREVAYMPIDELNEGARSYHASDGRSMDKVKFKRTVEVPQ